MSKIKSAKINNEYLIGETLEPMTPETYNDEILYNCSECSSMIEIISINEDNNTIEFNCLNKNNNHPKKNAMPIKEYLEKMKKYNNNKLNKDECEIHEKKYVSYCFDCNCHLCKECLKTRNHLNHRKNNIIEIEPMKEELNIIKEVILDYKNKIDNLSSEKLRKINELKNLLNDNKKSEEEKNKIIFEKNEEKKINELKRNNNKYINDINKIIQNCLEEIKLRKEQYLIDNRKIINKFKLINKKLKIIYENKIKELTKKINEEINNLNYDEKILNYSNIKKIDEIILNTYNMYNNNYYNAININSVLLRYMKNDYIKNNIMQKILKDKYDEICNTIQKRNKINIKFNISNNVESENTKNENEKSSKLLTEQKEEIKKISSEYLKQVEINREDYEKKIETIKNEYENKLKEIKIENDKIMNKYEENIENLLKKINISKEELDKKDEIYKIEITNLKNDYDKQLSFKSKEHKTETIKLSNSYQNAITDKEQEITLKENIITKLKEENKNNIKKFEEYLKILEKRISFVNNEITIIYKINKNDKFVKIFDEDFVKDKKDFCKILYEGKEYELQGNFNVENINEELLEIKLKIVKKITSFYGMFYQCKSLLYVPDISKFDTSNIIRMNDMFCDCSSLLFLPDISNWNTSKVEKFGEMFYGCESLMFLPDISKWDTSNVIKMDYMFKNCKSLLYLPDISKWNIKNVQSKKSMFKGCDNFLIIPKKFI